MKAKLIVVGGTASTTEVHLRLPAVIGRGRSVQVTIPHSLVSRQHCEISECEGRLVVRDLDSMNGTYVGDERIIEATLEPGALLTVGTVTFRAMYEVGDGESQSDDSDDTAHDEDMLAESDDSIGVDLVPTVDDATVAVRGKAFNETYLPPRLPDKAGEASDIKATQPMPERADVSSLESAAKNSD